MTIKLIKAIFNRNEETSYVNFTISAVESKSLHFCLHATYFNSRVLVKAKCHMHNVIQLQLVFNHTKSSSFVSNVSTVLF